MSRIAPSSRASRTDLAILLAFAGLLFLVSLGARDLWHPNEPTYGQAVLEMAERGDYLVPTVAGKDFPEKPILYYWMALAASRLGGGVSELTLRLPLALSGLLGVALLYLLVRPYTSRFRAVTTALLYATTFMVYWGARAIQMDSLVAVSTLGVVLAVTRVTDRALAPHTGWALAGLAAGLGFAAKGPVALVLPAVVLLSYLATTRRLALLATPALLTATLVCLAVALPWLLALWVYGKTEFLAELLFRQNLTRYLKGWDHPGPWWYYLKYFWIDMAPWAWFVPLAVALPDRDAPTRRLERLAWVWIIGVVVFFSLSASKRSAYILPVAPAVAILAGGLAERLRLETLPRWRRGACLALLCLGALLPAAAAWYYRGTLISEYPEMALYVRSLLLLLTAGAAATLAGLLGPFRARFAVPSAFFSMVLSLYMLGSIAILPAVNRYKSPREFSARVNAVVRAEEPLASFGFWRWRAGYLFYTRREIPNLESVEDLAAYWAADRRAFLLVHGRKLDEARMILGDSREIINRRIGSKTAYLFSNRSAELPAPDATGPGRRAEDHGSPP